MLLSSFLDWNRVSLCVVLVLIKIVSTAKSQNTQKDLHHCSFTSELVIAVLSIYIIIVLK